MTIYDDDNTAVTGVKCSLCQKHNTKGLNGSSIWNEQPCISVRLDVLRNHEKSSQHHTALRLDVAQEERDIALDQLQSQEFKAIKGAFKLFHFLIKRNIPYSTNFVPLLDICIELGAADLNHLQKGGNASYTSKRTIEEFLECLGDTVEEDTVAKFKNPLHGGHTINTLKF